jgi:urocanate hydratase
MTDDDFKRLEGKVDKLADAVMKLVLVEERQINQGERIGKVEQRAAAFETAIQRIDRKVEMWINRGIGVWGLAALLFTLLQFGGSWIKG